MSVEEGEAGTVLIRLMPGGGLAFRGLTEAAILAADTTSISPVNSQTTLSQLRQMISSNPRLHDDLVTNANPNIPFGILWQGRWICDPSEESDEDWQEKTLSDCGFKENENVTMFVGYAWSK